MLEILLIAIACISIVLMGLMFVRVLFKPNEHIEYKVDKKKKIQDEISNKLQDRNRISISDILGDAQGDKSREEVKEIIHKLEKALEETEKGGKDYD